MSMGQKRLSSPRPFAPPRDIARLSSSPHCVRHFVRWSCLLTKLAATLLLFLLVAPSFATHSLPTLRSHFLPSAFPISFVDTVAALCTSAPVIGPSPLHIVSPSSHRFLSIHLSGGSTSFRVSSFIKPLPLTFAAALTTINVASQMDPNSRTLAVSCEVLPDGITLQNFVANAHVLIEGCTSTVLSTAHAVGVAGIGANSTLTIRNTALTYKAPDQARSEDTRCGAIVFSVDSTMGTGSRVIIEGSSTLISVAGAGADNAFMSGILASTRTTFEAGFALTIRDGAQVVVRGASVTGAHLASMWGEGSSVTMASDVSVTVDNATIGVQSSSGFAKGMTLESAVAGPRLNITLSNTTMRVQAASAYASGLDMEATTVGTGASISVNKGSLIFLDDGGDDRLSRSTLLRILPKRDPQQLHVDVSESTLKMVVSEWTSFGAALHAWKFGDGSTITFNHATVTANVEGAAYGVYIGGGLGDNTTVSLLNTKVHVRSSTTASAGVMFIGSPISFHPARVEFTGCDVWAHSGNKGSTGIRFQTGKTRPDSSIVVAETTLRPTGRYDVTGLVFDRVNFAGLTDLLFSKAKVYGSAHVYGATSLAFIGESSQFGAPVSVRVMNGSFFETRSLAQTTTGVACISISVGRTIFQGVSFLFQDSDFGFSANNRTENPAAPNGVLVAPWATPSSWVDIAVTFRRCSVSGFGGSPLTLPQLLQGVSPLVFERCNFVTSTVLLLPGAAPTHEYSETATICLKALSLKAPVQVPRALTSTTACMTINVTQRLINDDVLRRDGSAISDEQSSLSRYASTLPPGDGPQRIRWSAECGEIAASGADIVSIPPATAVDITRCQISTTAASGVRFDGLPAQSSLTVAHSSVNASHSTDSVALELRVGSEMGTGSSLTVVNTTLIASGSSFASGLALAKVAGGHDVVVTVDAVTIQATASSPTGVWVTGGFGDGFSFLITNRSMIGAEASHQHAIVGLSIHTGAHATIAVTSGSQLEGTSAGLSLFNSRLGADATVSFNQSLATVKGGTAHGLVMNNVTAEPRLTLACLSPNLKAIGEDEAISLLLRSVVASNATLFLYGASFNARAASATTAAMVLHDTVLTSTEITITDWGAVVAITGSADPQTSGCFVARGGSWSGVTLTVTLAGIVVAPTLGNASYFVMPPLIERGLPTAVTLREIRFGTKEYFAVVRPPLQAGPSATLCVIDCTWMGLGNPPLGPVTGFAPMSWQPQCPSVTVSASLTHSAALSTSMTPQATATLSTYLTKTMSVSPPPSVTATPMRTMAKTRTLSAVPPESSSAEASSSQPTSASSLPTSKKQSGSSSSSASSQQSLPSASSSSSSSVASSHTSPQSSSAASSSHSRADSKGLSSAASSLRTATRTLTWTAELPTDAPRPPALPAAVQEVDNAVQSVAGIMSVASPVSAGIAIRAVTAARATTCKEPGDEPLPEWPWLARPVPIPFGLSAADAGIAYHDAALLAANLTLLAAYAALCAVLCGAVIVLGDGLLPGADVRAAAVGSLRHLSRRVVLAALVAVELSAPVLVLLVQLFLVPSVAAAVAIVTLSDRVPGPAVAAGAMALATTAGLYVALCIVCVVGWWTVVSHSPATKTEDVVANAKGQEPADDPETDTAGDGGSAVDTASSGLAAAGMDNGPDWEPTTVRPAPLLLFHLWRHLAGDGRAPAEGPIARSAGKKVLDPFDDEPLLEDHDSASSEESDEVHEPGPCGRLVGFVTWRRVAVVGAWWLGLAELTMSFWSGVATGLARAGYCTVAPWAALVLQAAFVLLLFVTWPIRAPTLAWLQLAVQLVQLASLCLDMSVAQSGGLDTASAALTAIAEWSAVVLTLGLLLVGVAAVGVRALRTLRPSAIAEKLRRWKRDRAAAGADAELDLMLPADGDDAPFLRTSLRAPQVAQVQPTPHHHHDTSEARAAPQSDSVSGEPRVCTPPLPPDTVQGDHGVERAVPSGADPASVSAEAFLLDLTTEVAGMEGRAGVGTPHAAPIQDTYGAASWKQAGSQASSSYDEEDLLDLCGPRDAGAGDSSRIADAALEAVLGDHVASVASENGEDDNGKDSPASNPADRARPLRSVELMADADLAASDPFLRSTSFAARSSRPLHSAGGNPRRHVPAASPLSPTADRSESYEL